MLISAFVALVIILTIATSTVYAGGPRFDPGSDEPGAFGCWVDGFDDGANQSFDDDRDKECRNIDDQYSKGFEAGNRLCHGEHTTAVQLAVEGDCETARQSPESQSQQILVPLSSSSSDKQQPPSGPFCDEQPSEGGCYDRNDNPEQYCLKYDDPIFCKTIGDICDQDVSIKPEYEYCKQI